MFLKWLNLQIFIGIFNSIKFTGNASQTREKFFSSDGSGKFKDEKSEAEEDA